MARKQPEVIIIVKHEPDMDRMVAALKIALGIKREAPTPPVSHRECPLPK